MAGSLPVPPPGVGVVTLGVGVLASGPAGDAGGAAAGGSAVEWAEQPVTAMAAAMTAVARMRAGRMATFSLLKRDAVGLEPQHGLDQSRHGAGRASHQRQNGLDPAAIVDRNEHAF
jgi:hypothetical protein